MDYLHTSASKERLVPDHGQYQEVPSSAVEGVEIEDLRLEFNRDLRTRNLCLFGLGISYIASLTAIGIGGSYLNAASNDAGKNVTLLVADDVNKTVSELLPLALSLGVTCINECLGFIHSAAQRWSLQRENRLKFNSNVRLFSGSRTSIPNSRYANILYTVCLVLSYASASQSFYTQDLHDDQAYVISGYQLSTTPAAFTVLGAAILVQCIVVTWAFWATDIPTWSSNPFNTIKACQSGGSLRRIGGRCMLGVDKEKKPAAPTKPRRSQPSAWSSHRDVRIITIFIWCILPVYIVWFGVLCAMIKNNDAKGSEIGGFLGEDWSFFPNAFDTPYIKTKWAAQGQAKATLQTLAISASIQFLLTIGLHTAELQVNLSRDEAFWRRMTSSRGCRITDYDSAWAAVKSWQYLVLFFSKTIIHWLYGMAINITTFAGSNTADLVMRPVQILYLNVGLFPICLFCTFLALKKPRGPLPATYGHLQTMANIIDEWHDTLYWGHKSRGEVNHAGTSGSPFLKFT